MKIPSSRPVYDQSELGAVESVLENGYTAEGEVSSRLEKALANRLSRDDCIVTNNGTSAIRLALEALGIGNGDEVILPAYTCQAVINPVIHSGAEPILADVDPDTFSLSKSTVEECLTSDTELIILVHNFGQPNLDSSLYELGVPVLEDVAQAIAPARCEKPPGSEGILTIGSMYATKQIGAGFGGFVAGDDAFLMGEVNDLKQYDGREEFRSTFNAGLSDVLAAIALEQIDKLDEHHCRRSQVAQQYDDHFIHDTPFDIPNRPPGHALYRYVVKGKPSIINQYETFMNGQEIEVKRPVYKALSLYFDEAHCPTSDQLHERVRLIPLLSDMNDEEVNYVLDSSQHFFEHAT